MKYLSLLFFLSSAYTSFSQTIEIYADEFGEPFYEEIIENNNANADQIYAAAMKWIAIHYSTLDIELDDPERGQVIFKAVTKYRGIEWPNGVTYVVVLNIKDEKVKLTITNFIDSYARIQKSTFRKGLINAVNEDLQKPIEALRREIQQADNTKDGW